MKTLYVGPIDLENDRGPDCFISDYYCIPAERCTLENMQRCQLLEKRTPEQSDKRDRLAEWLAVYFFQKLWKEIDEHHGLGLGIEFWGFSIIGTCYALIQHFLDFDFKLSKLKSSGSNGAIVTPTDEAIEAPFDLSEMIDGFSLHAEAILPRLWNVWLSALSEKQRPVVIIKKTEKEIGSVFVLNSNIKHESLDMLYLGLNRIEIAALGFLSKAKKKEKSEITTFKRLIEKFDKQSEELRLLENSEQFLENAEISIRRLLPRIYFDRELIAQNANKKYSHFVISPGRISRMTAILLQLGAAHAKGATLVGIQHGGHQYGSARSLGLFNFTEFLYSIFLSWGWKGPTGLLSTRVHTLPSPLLSKFKSLKARESSDFIWVGTQAYTHHYRYQDNPSADYCLEYRQEGCSFFSELGTPAKERVVYRPYPSSEGTSVDLHRLIPSLKTNTRVTHEFWKDLKGASLAIIDHPGTTLNMVLAANVPTICFWNPSGYLMNESARRFFDLFRKAGILHDSGHSAAQLLNQLSQEDSDGIERWWSAPHRQQLVEEWCNEYAQTSSNWRMEWARFFLNLNRQF